MTIKFRSLTERRDINLYSGGGLKGSIDISYAELVAVLGEPLAEFYDTIKSDADWCIHFGSGQVATIYNYKDGRNYKGLGGKDKEDIRDWHIGGKSQAVLRKMSELFPKHVVQ